jgi:YidC/Oxa1 family membrane protein insertase
MDRNSIIGILLITALFAGYFMLYGPSSAPQPQPAPQEARRDSSAQALAPQPGEPTTQITVSLSEPDSVKQARLRDKYSDFAPATQGQDSSVLLKTDKLSLQLRTLGGAVKELTLNEFRTYDSLPLPVVADLPGNAFYFEFPYQNRVIRSDELYFRPQPGPRELSGSDSLVFVMRAEIDSVRAVEQVYTFRAGRYDYGYQIRMRGLRDNFRNDNAISLRWRSTIPRTELALEPMRQKSTIVTRISEDIEKLDISNDPQKENYKGLVQWVAYKSQFFTHILDAEEPFKAAAVSMNTPENDASVNRVMETQFSMEIDPAKEAAPALRVYAGPNEYYTLRSYKREYEEQMDLGWWLIGWINIGTTYVFKFLERYVGNYGLIIIILAVLIRLLTLPFSLRSYLSMAKMRVVNQAPEMKELDEKYKDDMQKLQMAKMGIYREMGVSMFGGCLPMLLMYPFLIALFFFFPQAVELRHQSFLWAADLSTYDSILKLPFAIPMYGSHVSLFTLLMAASTFVYTYYQQKSQPTSPATEQFKYVIYFMPFMLLFFLNNYSSGLNLYYFVSNVLSIAQNTIIRQFVDDAKLMAKMRATQQKAKASGKGGNSGGKSRLESWMEGQQRKQEDLMRMRRQQQATNRQMRRNTK